MIRLNFKKFISILNRALSIGIETCKNNYTEIYPSIFFSKKRKKNEKKNEKERKETVFVGPVGDQRHAAGLLYSLNTVSLFYI